MFNSLPAKIAAVIALLAALAVVASAQSRSSFNQSHSIIVKLEDAPAASLRKAGTFAAASPELHAVLAFRGPYSASQIFPTGVSPLLDQYVIIDFNSSAAVSGEIVSALQSQPQVESVQFNHHFELDAPITASPLPLESGFVPDDSLYDSQWALQTIQAEQAWATTTGSPDVLIAVIDTGVELDHPDLQANIWINPGEDLNADGKRDSTDFNGVDDDSNGFVDDIVGWDFTDARNFPDGGDFLIRDNDPSDENGHGTAVAGIIAAVAGNGIGVAGLAPDCRVMVLRAGTSQGFLEEDDVAAALVYAVTNGARGVNMSFGDTVVSPMLRDVISFVYQSGVVLVTSAGNSATDLPHYPSGFAETIAVGSTNRDDFLAGFSNFGTTIDCVAPGMEIWTTKIGRSYAKFAGTSASAPFVSALAGLILSQRPHWHHEIVRAAIQNTADDLGATGWDELYGAGRINAARAVQAERVARCEIQSPVINAGFAGTNAEGPGITIRGTVLGAFVDRYEISVGAGDNPNDWTVISEGEHRQVLSDSLGVWQDGSAVDTSYTLRVTAYQQGGPRVEDKVRIYLDRTAPKISQVTMSDMIDGDRHSVLIEFETDDLCRSKIGWRSRDTGDEFTRLPLNYQTRSHRINFSQQIATGRFEFFIEAENRSGLRTRDSNSGTFYRFDLDQPEIYLKPLVEVSPEASSNLPAGLMLHSASDFDRDGRSELILSPYGDKNTIGELTIFEEHAAGFTRLFESGQPAIARDIGDSDRDGRWEILAGIGPVSMIFEAGVAGGFPSHIVWVDTNDFWASRFADVDQDGRTEIVARVGDLFSLWENTGDNAFDWIVDLPNPTPGSNFVGVPHTEVGDFDGDGATEILFGDFDGDLYLYEAAGNNRVVATWVDSLPLIDSIDFLRAGDFDGDGQVDFAAGCHSSSDLNSEHEFDARHWLYRIYRGVADDTYEVAWEQRFFGFQSPKDFDAGAGAGDFDQDGRDELLICVFPDAYLVEFDNQTFEVVWHTAPVRSNTAVFLPAGERSAGRIALSDGNAIRLYQERDAGSGAPAPLDIAAQPTSEQSVALRWRAVAGAEAYAIYRSTLDSALSLLAVTPSASYLDSNLVTEQQYAYSIATVDSQNTRIIGPLSREVTARPSAAPRLLCAQFVSPSHVTLMFDEPLAATALESGVFTIESLVDLPAGAGQSLEAPASIASVRDGSELILSYARRSFLPGKYRISVSNVNDLEQVAIDPAFAAATFSVATGEGRFYLTSATVESPKAVVLTFNRPLEPASADDKQNYTITAAGATQLRPSIARVERLGSQMASIRIHLADGFIAATGIRYEITVKNIRSLDGLAIQPGEGDVIGFAASARTLDKVVIFPNPFIAGRHHSLTIGGLTSKALIKILDLDGRVLLSFEETDGNGGFDWDGRDASGRVLPSGVYVCYITSGEQTVFEKFVIVN